MVALEKTSEKGRNIDLSRVGDRHQYARGRARQPSSEGYRENSRRPESNHTVHHDTVQRAAKDCVTRQRNGGDGRCAR